MSDPVTQAQFYAAVQQLRDLIDLRHTTLRTDIWARFDALDEKLDTHEDADLVVERRVTIIETQRAEEAKLAIKHGSWAGILAAAGLTSLIAIVKAMFGK